MAATRLLPLAARKGCTVGQKIRGIIDYTENPQKADGGRLITSRQCDSRIADAEFLFTKNQYIQKVGSVRGEDDVIACHLRQSFVPGAAGNVATEDVLHMCEEMGVETGIDLDQAMSISRRIVQIIDHSTDSYLLRAGKSKDLIRDLPTGQIANQTMKRT